MENQEILRLTHKFKVFFNLITNKTDVVEIREQFELNIEDLKYVYERIKKRNDYKNLPVDFISYFSLDENLGCKYFFYNDFGGGEFNLSWINRKLKLDNYDEELGYDGQPEEDVRLFKTFRVIDSHPDAADNKWGVISLVEGVSPPNEPPVYFVDRGRAFNMNMFYGDYINALLETCAIYNWQYLYCNVDLSDKGDFPNIYHSLNQGIQGLEDAFPERDFSKLRKLLESKR